MLNFELKVIFFFFDFQPGRDASGAAIALFTAHLHSPLNVTHKTTLQGVVYQLDAALQSSETQKAGLVFIYDMSGSKYSNFDYDLSQKILTLLKVSAFFHLRRFIGTRVVGSILVVEAKRAEIFNVRTKISKFWLSEKRMTKLANDIFCFRLSFRNYCHSLKITTKRK